MTLVAIIMLLVNRRTPTGSIACVCHLADKLCGCGGGGAAVAERRQTHDAYSRRAWNGPRRRPVTPIGAEEDGKTGCYKYGRAHMGGFEASGTAFGAGKWEPRRVE